jgi:hypothetical protein
MGKVSKPHPLDDLFSQIADLSSDSPDKESKGIPPLAEG